MAVIEYLDIILQAQTTSLDAGIAKELKQLDLLEKKQAENDRKLAESQALKAREAADARHDRRLLQSLALNRSVMTGEEKHAELVNRYTKMRDRGNISQETYNRLILKSIAENKQLARSYDEVTFSGERAANSQKGNAAGGAAMAARGGLSGLATLVGVGTIAAGYNTVAGTVDSARQIESATKSLEVLTGSATKAKFVMDSLISQSAKAGIEIGSLKGVATMLAGPEKDAKKLIETMRRLGEVAQGDSDKMNRLGLQYSQVLNANQFRKEEFNIFAEIGADVREFAKAAGFEGPDAMQKLFKAFEDGSVKADVMVKGFEAMTNAGGRFYGMTDAMAKTSGGIKNQKNAALASLSAEIGKDFAPFFDQVNSLIAKTANAVAEGSKKTRKYFEEVKTEAFDASKAVGDTWVDQYKRVAEAQNAAKAAADAKEQAFLKKGEKGREDLEQTIAQLEEEKRSLTMSPKEIAKQQITGGIGIGHQTENDKFLMKYGLRLLEENEILKKKKEAEEEAAQLKKQEAKDLEDAAKKKIADDKQAAERVKESLLDTDGKLRKQLEELMRLKDQGLINSEEFNKAAQKTGEDLTSNQQRGAVSAQEGSVEAYKLILEREQGVERRDAIAQKTRETMLSIQKQQLEALKKFPKVKAAR